MDPVTRWWGCVLAVYRGGICQCRHCRRQCKIFVSGANFSIFTHFRVLSLKLLKLGEIDGVKFLAWKSGSVKFLTNSMSGCVLGQYGTAMVGTWWYCVSMRAVLGGNWRDRASRGLLCLYILNKVEIWSDVTHAWQTDRLWKKELLSS